MNLDGYIDVPTRLKMAAERWPDLRISELAPTLIDVAGQLFVNAAVIVHRFPDDPLPVTAYCWEPYPGKSAFTRGSEQPNASTSAVGRALRWILPDIAGPVASADEVRNATTNRAAEPEPKRSRPAPVVEQDPAGAIPRLASDPQKRLISRLLAEKDYQFDGDVDLLSMSDATALIDVLKQMEPVK